MQTTTEEDTGPGSSLLIETEYLTLWQANLVKRLPLWLAVKELDWLVYLMVSRKDWALMVEGELPITDRPGLRRALDDACKLVLGLRRVFPGKENAGTSYHAGQWLHLENPEFGATPWQYFAFGEIQRCEVLAKLGEMTPRTAISSSSPFQSRPPAAE